MAPVTTAHAVRTLSLCEHYTTLMEYSILSAWTRVVDLTLFWLFRVLPSRWAEQVRRGLRQVRGDNHWVLASPQGFSPRHLVLLGVKCRSHGLWSHLAGTLYSYFKLCIKDERAAAAALTETCRSPSSSWSPVTIFNCFVRGPRYHPDPGFSRRLHFRASALE